MAEYDGVLNRVVNITLMQNLFIKLMMHYDDKCTKLTVPYFLIFDMTRQGEIHGQMDGIEASRTRIKRLS